MTNNKVWKIIIIMSLFITCLINFSNAAEKGDINFDNKYTEDDCSILRDFLLKKVELSEEEIKVADINNDGKVTITDLSLLKDIIANNSGNSSSDQERKIKDIRISKLPNKITFYKGEDINFDGLKVEAIYSNNDIEDITANCELSKIGNTILGRQKICVTYEGKSTSFFVMIIKDKEYALKNCVKKLKVLTSPNKVYYKYGEELDLTGLSLEKVYLKGNRENVYDYNIKGYNSNHVGTQILTITHEDKKEQKKFSTVIYVEVLDYIETVEVASYPQKETYPKGTTLKEMGVKIVANCASGTVKDITEDCEYIGFDNKKDGKQKITVKYIENIDKLNEVNEFTTQFDVEFFDPVTSVKLDTNEKTIIRGSSFKLNATVEPSYATNKNVIWFSSNPEIVTVDNNGTVIGVNKGSAIVKVTTVDRGYTATCKVTVIVPVTGVTLNKNSITINKGENEKLIETVQPLDATNKNVTWASNNTKVATVNNGVVTAVGSGNAIITVTTVDGGFKASCNITVRVPVQQVKLNKSAITINKGNKEKLTATILPEDTTIQNITWTSNNTKVATVNGGEVTAVGGGTAIITITVISTDGTSKSASCTVTVNVPVTGITLNKTSTTINRGGAETLIATIQPADATNKNVTWSSSNTGVVTVNNGVIKGVGKGNAVITAKTVDGGYTATCNVTVNVAVTGIALNKTSTTINKGGKETLTATITPADATNKNITWSSSNTGVATVNNGVVTAVGGGTSIITVRTADGGHTATCTVTVNVPVSGIALNKTSTTINRGGAETLKATITPTDATNKSITWSSSNTGVVTVNNGVITGVGKGNAVITAKTVDGGYTATCNVTVNATVSGISLNKSATTINKGGKETLTATITPTDATNKNVTWTSSNTAVATVSNGVVTAVGGGTTIITVKTADGGHTATCTVTVNVPVTGVTINKSSAILKEADTLTLSATVAPGDATNKNVTWTSNNTAVATVSNGVVTAVGVGSATIAVTTSDGSYKASCTITVEPINILFIGNSKTYYNNFPSMFRNACSVAKSRGDIKHTVNVYQFAFNVGSSTDKSGDKSDANRYTRFTTSGQSLREIINYNTNYLFKVLSLRKWDYIVFQEKTARATASDEANKTAQAIATITQYAKSGKTAAINAYNSFSDGTLSETTQNNITDNSASTRNSNVRVIIDSVQINNQDTNFTRQDAADAIATSVMQNLVSKGYVSSGNIKVAKTGATFKNYNKVQGKVIKWLYYNENEGQQHPSELGSYIRVCSVFKTIFGKMPYYNQGNPAEENSLLSSGKISATSNTLSIGINGIGSTATSYCTNPTHGDAASEACAPGKPDDGKVRFEAARKAANAVNTDSFNE